MVTRRPSAGVGPGRRVPILAEPGPRPLDTLADRGFLASATPVMSTRGWRIAATALAFAVGIGVGGFVGLAAHSSPHRSVRRNVTLPLGPITTPRARPVVADTMLAWTYNPLPAGFARRVAGLPGVARAVP